MEGTIDSANLIVTLGPRIPINPMPQRSEVCQPNEDWTGKSGTADRRKLQNRLNKRASSKLILHSIISN